MIDLEKLRSAVDYASKLLGRNISIEWGQKAISADFVDDAMSRSWTWGATVRAHYDASVKL